MMGDQQFWLGLLLGTIFSIPAGIVAILLAARVTSYLERRKLIKTRKTRQQALQIYKRMRAFREGKRDKYPYYMVLVSLAIVCAIVASTIVIGILLISPEFHNAMIWSLTAFALSMLSALFLVSIYETARQLERFDDYKKEFEQRWGPIDNEAQDSSTGG
jgi:Mg2+/citrate symporter